MPMRCQVVDAYTISHAAMRLYVQTVFVYTQKPRFMNRGSASDLKSYTILRIITVVGHILLAGFVVFGKTRDVG